MRTLRRPLFRGGSTGTGITSGLAPRQGYKGTDNPADQRVMSDWLRTATLGDVKKFASENRYQPRGTNVYDFLTEFGLNIASTPPQGNIFQTAAAAAKEPHQRFLAKKGEAEAAEYVSEADMFKTLIGAQADILGGEGSATYAATEIAKKVRELTGNIMDANSEIKKLESATEVTGAPVPGGTDINKDRIAELNRQIALDRSELNNLKKRSTYATNMMKSDTFRDNLVMTIMERLKKEVLPNGKLKYPEGDRDENLYKDAYQEMIDFFEQSEIKTPAAEGGRIGYAAAGPVLGQGLPTQIPTPEDTMPEELGDISYQELRARLPQEVSDEIVRLLANSAEALEDFATIQTEQDISNFNKKYGVNLVLPAEA